MLLDASTSPDNYLQVSRMAGLRIFMVTTLQNAASTIFIKIKLMECSYVIMAEASALAIAAKLLNALNVQQPFFLTDNQLLVNFFNGKDHTSPHRWDIKPWTQQFINYAAASRGKIYKIDTKQNITAHTLASQAYKSNVVQSSEGHYACNNPMHVSSCPVLTAINSVLGEAFTIIAASCC
jgi:hypothetical protein